MLYKAKEVLRAIDSISWYINDFCANNIKSICEDIVTDSQGVFTTNTIRVAKQALINSLLIPEVTELIRKDLVEFINVNRLTFKNTYEDDKLIIDSELVAKYYEAKDLLKEELNLDERQFDIVKNRLRNKFRYWAISYDSLSFITKLPKEAYSYQLLKDRNAMILKHFDLIVNQGDLSPEYKLLLDKHISKNSEELDLESLTLSDDDKKEFGEEDTLTFTELQKLKDELVVYDVIVIEDSINGTIYESSELIYVKILSVLDMIARVVETGVPTKKFNVNTLVYPLYKEFTGNTVNANSLVRQVKNFMDTTIQFTSTFKQYL